MTHTPRALINALAAYRGEDTARAIAHLERMAAEGCAGLSLGTFAPGQFPRSWCEWAKAFADLQDWLVRRTPAENAADLRAGEDFLKLDSALCERDWALNILAEIAARDRATLERVRETYKTRADALSYFENSLKLGPIARPSSVSETAPIQESATAASSSAPTDATRLSASPSTQPRHEENNNE